MRKKNLSWVPVGCLTPRQTGRLTVDRKLTSTSTAWFVLKYSSRLYCSPKFCGLCIGTETCPVDHREESIEKIQHIYDMFIVRFDCPRNDPTHLTVSDKHCRIIWQYWQAVSCALNLDPQCSAWLLVLACKACGSHFTAGSASTRNSVRWWSYNTNRVRIVTYPAVTFRALPSGISSAFLYLFI
jgi:hypothetical protein